MDLLRSHSPECIVIDVFLYTNERYCHGVALFPISSWNYAFTGQDLQICHPRSSKTATSLYLLLTNGISPPKPAMQPHQFHQIPDTINPSKNLKYEK
ncbi:hypothetical protein ACLOJK_014686 [Asimina triloba]